jgi:DRTGG domain.
MTINEIAAALRGAVETPPQTEDAQITAAHASDMLSDVMANAPEDSVLITIQNHINTVAVSVLAGVRAIAVCSSRPLPDDMKSAAAREGIALIATPLSQFEASVSLAALSSV